MTLDEIKKLADLARIEMSDEELENMAKDFDPILAYVGQVQEINKSNGGNDDIKPEDLHLYNITREDVASNDSSSYREKILNEMPDKENDYLKVKQIL